VSIDPRSWSMSEAALQESVRKMCDGLALTVQHVENSLQGRVWVKGWPDLAIIGTTIIYRELKRQSESPTADQRRIGAIIQRAHGDWAVWRPDDLYDGTIARQLTAISRLKISVFMSEDIQRIEGIAQ